MPAALKQVSTRLPAPDVRRLEQHLQTEALKVATWLRRLIRRELDKGGRRPVRRSRR